VAGIPELRTGGVLCQSKRAKKTTLSEGPSAAGGPFLARACGPSTPSLREKPLAHLLVRNRAGPNNGIPHNFVD